MKKRQRIQKADAAEATVTDDSAATHRLTGISVKEVSIVDRAANKRKYLLVKEEEQTKDAPAAKGDEEANKAVPGSPAQPPHAPAPPAPPTSPAPPTLRISPELKAKVAGVLKTVQERVGVISKVLEGSSETPGAAAPQELMTALNELAGIITQAAAPAAPPAGNPPPPAAPPAAAKEGESAETEKAGRKISAGRLQQLNTIQASLASLIADVSATETGDSGGDAGGDTGTTTEPAAGGTEKASAPSAEITELKAVVSTMADNMASMMKVFEQQNARIAELTKSRGESRQVDLDRDPVSKKKEDKVVWDLDMARPMRHID